jgi:hypothetical protein
MPDLSLEVIKSAKNEEIKRKQLLLAINKKRLELKQLVIKVELLKANLDMAKNEYMVKVGSLILKDNQLDLEIIRLKNIIYYMDKGLSFDQASSKVERKYYSEQIEFDKEQEKIWVEKEIYNKRDKRIKIPNIEIKKLWKKLISKFHPDLVRDSNEKIKRDKIMKQINRAYHEYDYDQLVRIENENLPQKENTIEDLEDKLIFIVNDILQQEENYKSLKLSEWHNWMEKINKAKKKNQNVFAETEKQLLNDITAKIELLKNLKLQTKEF